MPEPNGSEYEAISFRMAPMEGITGYVFRNTFHRHFKSVDTFYSPFISPGREGKGMKKRDQNDILPRHNDGIRLIPQLLCNRAEDFLWAAKRFQALGYGELNLNLGCPSGTVVAKHKGSGFLSETAELERFFEQLFAALPPGLSVSVKTRIGRDTPDEFFALMEIFNRFPISELIVHPRVQREFYRGEVHKDIFAYAAAHAKMPLCYNGDLWEEEDIRSVKQQFPHVFALMLGRGLIRDPLLLERMLCSPREMNGGREQDERNRLIAFHNDLVEGYQSAYSFENATLCRMKEFWGYFSDSFCDCEGELKKLKKSRTLSEYRVHASRVLREGTLKRRTQE